MIYKVMLGDTGTEWRAKVVTVTSTNPVCADAYETHTFNTLYLVSEFLRREGIQHEQVTWELPLSKELLLSERDIAKETILREERRLLIPKVEQLYNMSILSIIKAIAKGASSVTLEVEEDSRECISMLNDKLSPLGLIATPDMYTWSYPYGKISISIAD